MKIYHNPRCRKSREALATLQEKGIEPEIILYLEQVPTAAELSEIVKKLGISPLELIRKGESDFKEHFKGKQLTDSQWINAMVQFPKLIERPIVVEGNRAVIARPAELINQLL